MLRTWLGSGFLSSWRNAAWADLRERTILKSPDVTPIVTAEGTFLRFTGAGAAPSVSDVEWSQSILDDTSIRVIGGPVMWSNKQLDDGSPYYDVDYTGLSTNDVRWLFVEIDFQAVTVTPKFATTADLPIDDPDNLIVRWRLSQWTKTATGITRTMTAWPGGCIHFPAIFGPPLA